VAELIQERGLALVEDSGAIDRAVAEVLGRNAKIVADVKAGKLQAVGPLVGQVMKLLKGADPARVREAILQRIQES
jgi:aspartyl-tRNA(Asn)/glutamyl-tRNA(Gln) amidotransferase subunit B